MSAVNQVQANLQDIVYVIETWILPDGTSWYRKWSDRWIEQGGKVVISTDRDPPYQYHTVRLTYPVPFTRLIRWQCQARSEWYTTGFDTDDNNLSSVRLYQQNIENAPNKNPFVLWYACGYY